MNNKNIINIWTFKCDFVNNKNDIQIFKVVNKFVTGDVIIPVLDEYTIW
jgi:hypothetical protein